MTPELIALGRRAVACPRWKWRPGMSDTDGRRYQWRHENRQVEACSESSEGGINWEEPIGAIPDLSDDATTGAVLGLVRQAWCDPTAHTRWSQSAMRWEMLRSDAEWPPSPKWVRILGAGPTEAEALIAALGAAPPKETT